MAWCCSGGLYSTLTLFALYYCSHWRLYDIATYYFWSHNWATDAEPCSTKEAVAAESNTTALKLIIPSVGQTGTTSLTEAARLMGLRTYHIEETAVFAGTSLWDRVDPETFARAISRCRVEALALEPYTDLLRTALETSPHAKVVVTWRDFSSWSRSAVNARRKDELWSDALGYLTKSCRILPWIEIIDAATGIFTRLIAEGDPYGGVGETTIASIVMYKCFGVWGFASEFSNAFNRGSFIITSEEAYLAYLDEIRQVVPPERLFELSFQQHGWSDLRDFLGYPGIPSSGSLPHQRGRMSLTNDVLFGNSPWRGLVAIFSFCAMHAGNFIILRAALWALCWTLLLVPRAMLGSRK